ncbi:hypothetical protein [Arthrobacter sp. TS-15]|uniref:hypothetical protein n=1 Tax=Arthrobacter sp. TS-15 TaxID=2510797 RepID=UPI001EE86862|nr:hypothetical protein [Arthrobacter sp. TS-15]
MGWFTEGSDHEGYLVCVFAGGMYGSGGRYMEIDLMTPDGRAVGHEEDLARAAWRPPSQVVGWRVACSCVPFRENVILDPLWTRVWDPADEDVGRGAYLRRTAGRPRRVIERTWSRCSWMCGTDTSLRTCRCTPFDH